jgi:adenylylsulfate kinase
MSLVWLTGFSGSGKSTIAEAFHQINEAPILDGDAVRKRLEKGHIHGVEGQSQNLPAVIGIAKELLETTSCVIAAFVSPNKELRERVKKEIESDGYRFILVHVQASIVACRTRDPKSLYQRLTIGEDIKLAGINVPYDIPENPDVICRTEEMSAERCAQEILKQI